MTICFKVPEVRVLSLTMYISISEKCILPCSIIKDPHRYVVQGSDTTMITIAASLPGQ